MSCLRKGKHMANLRKLLCICMGGALATAAMAGVPANDDCTGAIAITSLPAAIMGDTTVATADVAPLCGTGDGTGGGLWYSIVGDGTTLTATTCSASTTFDTKLRVYTGDCNALVCEGGDDDDPACSFSSLRSTVSWCSTIGVEYKILVHGFSSATGQFELLVSSGGVPCSGACCLSDGTCLGALSAAACATAGGSYAGDGTDCNSVSCTGACCFGDGSCSNLSENDCNAMSGTFQGVGSDCNSVVCPMIPTNDDCATAIAVAIPSSTAGDNTLASPEPNSITSLPLCGTSVSLTGNGMWYSLVGNGNGVTVTTCNAASTFDSKIIVWAGDCNSLTCVGGNDDDFDCNFSGLRSTVTFCSEPGQEYRVLVMGFSGSSVGAFQLDVIDNGSCRGACCLPDTSCIGPVTAAACGTAGGLYQGDGTDCNSVNCVPPPANDNCSGAIAFTSIPGTVTGSTTFATNEANNVTTCGTTITAPGVWHSLVGTGNTITVTTCFAATDFDTKLNVYTGDCNALVCVGGNDDSFGDPDCNFPRGIGLPSKFSFCSSPGVTYLILVQGFGGATGDYTLEATDDGIPCTGACCLGDGNCVDGVSAAACSTLGGRFTAGATCGSVVCSGACCLGDGTCLYGSSDDCATAGGTYGGDGSDCNSVSCVGACCFTDGSCSGLSPDDCATAGGTFQGLGSDCNSVVCPIPPANDDCADAIPLSLPGSVMGNNSLATVDSPGTCGTSVGTVGDVWYTVVGTGNQIRLTTCAPGTNFDTKIQVWCGDCGALTCVGGNDDGSPSGASPDPNCVTDPGSTANRASTFTFCSQFGAVYHIAVFGFSGQSGDFELHAVDLGTPCAATVQCLPTGACCVGLTCSITTQFDCANMGGSYQGDNTNCGGQVYTTIDDCNNAFEDISGTGALAAFASSGDDNAEEVPVGFTFTFFNDDHNSVWISSNGLMVFPPSTEADADDFSNDVIPSTIIPNNFIAPLWDDLTTSAATATVHYETQGAAPNRRLIVQWTNVPELAATVTNTFQAILSEGSNKIELRYGPIDPQTTANDYTVGVENQTGTAGLAVNTALLAAGDCYCILPVCYSNPCCPDVDGGGNVDLADLAGLLSGFGSMAGDPLYTSKADLDQDGDIDLSDLAGLLARFGQTCP